MVVSCVLVLEKQLSVRTLQNNASFPEPDRIMTSKLHSSSFQNHFKRTEHYFKVAPNKTFDEFGQNATKARCRAASNWRNPEETLDNELKHRRRRVPIYIWSRMWWCVHVGCVTLSITDRTGCFTVRVLTLGCLSSRQQDFHLFSVPLSETFSSSCSCCDRRVSTAVSDFTQRSNSYTGNEIHFITAQLLKNKPA